MVILAWPSMRLTGSIVMRFIARSLSKLQPEIGFRPAPFQQVRDYSGDGLGRWRTTGQGKVDLHKLAKRAGLLKQRRYAVVRNDFPFLRAVDVNALEQLVDRNGIAHGGDVAGNRAVPKRNQ